MCLSHCILSVPVSALVKCRRRTPGARRSRRPKLVNWRLAGCLERAASPGRPVAQRKSRRRIPAPTAGPRCNRVWKPKRGTAETRLLARGGSPSPTDTAEPLVRREPSTPSSGPCRRPLPALAEVHYISVMLRSPVSATAVLKAWIRRRALLPPTAGRPFASRGAWDETGPARVPSASATRIAAQPAALPPTAAPGRTGQDLQPKRGPSLRRTAEAGATHP